MAPISFFSSMSCRSAVCNFSCLSASCLMIPCSSFSNICIWIANSAALPLFSFKLYSAADNKVSFSVFCFSRLLTIVVSPLTLRSANRMSDWSSPNTCWWSLILSSIVVHSSDNIRRYSSVVLCRAPVSDMLVPLDIPHFVLTSAKKSVWSCFILALYSNLSLPAKISLYAKRLSLIGRSVQWICGFNSSRCTMNAAMFCSPYLPQTNE